MRNKQLLYGLMLLLGVSSSVSVVADGGHGHGYRHGGVGVGLYFGVPYSYPFYAAPYYSPYYSQPYYNPNYLQPYYNPYYSQPYSYTYPYAYPYSYYPPVVVSPAPAQSTVYIEKPQAEPAPVVPAANYWFYCSKPEGYYPYIKACPGGWRMDAPTLSPQR